MLRGHVTAQKGVGFASRKATQQGQEWCLSSSCTRQAMYTPPLPPLPLTPTPFPKLPLSPPQLPPPLVPRPRIEPGRRHQCAASLLHCCRQPLACARVVCVLRACKCLCVRVCLCAMVCVAPRRVGSRRAASRRVGSGRAVPHRVGSDYHNVREREREEREREKREREKRCGDEQRSRSPINRVDLPGTRGTLRAARAARGTSLWRGPRASRCRTNRRCRAENEPPAPAPAVTDGQEPRRTARGCQRALGVWCALTC